jgi:hydrogenase nickel incorporation protein HypA/HybF
MHELSIAAAVVEQVTTRLPGTPVSLVRLRIGTLSGVVPSAVEFCFSLAAAGTTLEGAVLEIEHVPARCRCSACDREFQPHDQILLCECGSARVTILAGADLQIASVDTAPCRSDETAVEENV